ncbi:MAG: DUF455 family protein [Bacteriovoracaceae bacterium]
MEELRAILEGETLEDKLTCFEINPSKLLVPYPSHFVSSPGRNTKISFSESQIKFPKSGSLSQESQRAKALHFFANHELLAIEIFANFYLKFLSPLPGNRKLKLHVLQTIKEEQRHLSLYIDRIRQLGIDFGDYPLNDFFWRQFEQTKTVDEFFAAMSLTFEAANLDFAYLYSKIFRKYEDHKSADVLDIVLKDELRHVSVGVKYLNEKKGDVSLWDYYSSSLPPHISPSRGKGQEFRSELRALAGLDNHFIDMQCNYKSDFQVLNRKKNKLNEKILH